MFSRKKNAIVVIPENFPHLTSLIVFYGLDATKAIVICKWENL